jgi:hypothetical protein
VIPDIGIRDDDDGSGAGCAPAGLQAAQKHRFWKLKALPRAKSSSSRRLPQTSQ